jgi:hypothetical protein
MLEENPARAVKSADPFAPLSTEERKRELDAYLSHLHARNGMPNRSKRELPKREDFFRDLAARRVKWVGPLDRESFHRMLQRPSERDLDPRVLWLLTAAKANQSERYAVELELQPGRRHSKLAVGDPMEFVTLEEVYHTRILLESCRVFDLEFEMGAPSWRTSAFINLLVRAPRVVRQPLVLGREVVGATIFQILLEQTALFCKQPPVAERLRLLVREILQDEIGHIVYCRATIGRVGLRLARKLLPILVRAVLRDGREVTRLAGGPEELMDRVMKFDIAEASASTESLRLPRTNGRDEDHEARRK